MKFIVQVGALFLLTAVSAFSQGRPNGNAIARTASPAAIDYETARLSRIVTAVRITEKITLDGRLDEPAWKLALPATDFTQQRPRTGEPATERTEVRFLYDDENLYAGAICFESNMARIVVNDVREDYPWNESDGMNISIDSLHDRRSGFSFDVNPAGGKRDGQLANDSQFLSDWDAVWDAKVTRNDQAWIVEFVIPFKTLRFSESSSEWGLQLSRRLLSRNEDDYWAPIPIRYSGARMSMAGTLRGLEGIHQGRNLKVKPFATAGITQVQGAKTSKDYDGGVDIKYSLTPQLTLDTTYRTDFAQVEVDQQQVNLTRFNLFFPEKRDFFLENTAIFNFGPDGGFFGGFGRGSNLIPFFSRRIGLSTAGTPIPIIGGARVSGKVSQYDVGFIAMKSGRNGTTPSNNFIVGRVKRNLLQNSWIGSLVTNRDSTLAGDYNRVYGPDAHFQFFGKLEFDSFLLRSDTPDRSGSNQARRFQTGWRDDELSVTAEYNSIQRHFNPEVGFVRRRDFEQYAGDFAWKPQLPKSDLIRNLHFGTSFDYYGGSSSGKVETRTSETTLGILFENNAWATFVINQTFDRLAAPLGIPAGNPHVEIAPGDYKYLSYTGNFTTNQRRKLSGNGAYTWGDFYNGERKAIRGGFNVKPNYHLTMEFTLDRNQVKLPNGPFTVNLVGAKFIYGFSPRAFFNAFIQYNADTHQVSSNIRFDLIHHPLSDLYLVYNDTRDTLTRRVLERAFIVKLTNLFSF